MSRISGSTRIHGPGQTMSTRTPDRVDIAGAHVVAVLVTLDAARWLPATLEALAELDTRPTRLIAIDNASTDATRTLLDRAYDEGVLDAVYEGQRDFGFGTAVRAALEADAANLQDDADTIGFRAVSADDTHWLWLLHDDAVPAPDALYQLLAHVTTEPSIDLTGPKLLLPRQPPRRPTDQRGRGEHFRHRAPRARPRRGRDRPGSA